MGTPQLQAATSATAWVTRDPLFERLLAMLGGSDAKGPSFSKVPTDFKKKDPHKNPQQDLPIF